MEVDIVSNDFNKKQPKQNQAKQSSQSFHATKTLPNVAMGMSNQARLSMLRQHTRRSGSSNMPSPSSGTPLDSAMQAKFEQQFGLPMEDVRIHYNSDQPARFGAKAYTYGSHIFIGRGHEKSLEHEMTHVVQQKMGQVQPTGTEQGMAINRSPLLEHNADIGAVSQTWGTAAKSVVQCCGETPKDFLKRIFPNKKNAFFKNPQRFKDNDELNAIIDSLNICHGFSSAAITALYLHNTSKKTNGFTNDFLDLALNGKDAYAREAYQRMFESLWSAQNTPEHSPQNIPEHPPQNTTECAHPTIYHLLDYSDFMEDFNNEQYTKYFSYQSPSLILFFNPKKGGAEAKDNTYDLSHSMIATDANTWYGSNNPAPPKTGGGYYGNLLNDKKLFGIYQFNHGGDDGTDESLKQYLDSKNPANPALDGKILIMPIFTEPTEPIEEDDGCCEIF